MIRLSILKGGKNSRLRGLTEVGLVPVLTVAVAGVLFKTGLAPTSLSTSDSLTWLANVTQVDDLIPKDGNTSHPKAGRLRRLPWQT